MERPEQPPVIEHKLPFDDRDLAAARLLDAAIDPGKLPAFIPGEPWGLAALEVATEITPALMDALAELYGLDAWDRESFREHYLGGALAAWRGDLHVQDAGDEIHLGAVGCPLLVQARRDPRACHMCQLVHEAAARHAMPGTVEEVRFERLIARGDDTCEATVELEDR